LKGKIMTRKGFTLLELIIVIIIVGAIASLALPRFFRVVEFSRSTEALVAMSAIRQALERCYIMKSGTYIGCGNFAGMSLDDPGTLPNAHFTYSVANQSATGYKITATRNTYEGGSTSSKIILTQTATSVMRSGEGAFAGLQ
jgi:prepilin-type N-terminal cleavage/methylation domain-containing protein